MNAITKKSTLVLEADTTKTQHMCMIVIRQLHFELNFQTPEG